MVHLFRLNYLVTISGTSGIISNTRFFCLIEFPDRTFPTFNAEWNSARFHIPWFKRVAPQPASVDQRWQLHTPNGKWPFGPRIGEWLGQGRGLANVNAGRETHVTGFNFEGCGRWIQVHGWCKGPASFAEHDIAAFLDEAASESAGLAACAEDATTDQPSLLPRSFEFDPPGGFFLAMRLGFHGTTLSLNL